MHVLVLQFGYTTVFGWYATFIYLRTGSLYSAFMCHAICNFFGFPNFAALVDSDSHVWRIRLMYILGLAGFIYFLFPLTDPNYYKASLWMN